jgi:hypothetical protein
VALGCDVVPVVAVALALVVIVGVVMTAASDRPACVPDALPGAHGDVA